MVMASTKETLVCVARGLKRKDAIGSSFRNGEAEPESFWISLAMMSLTKWCPRECKTVRTGTDFSGTDFSA